MAIPLPNPALNSYANGEEGNETVFNRPVNETHANVLELAEVATRPNGLRPQANSPADNKVKVQPGTFVKSDGLRILSLAAETQSAAFPVVSAAGKVRYDLLQIKDDATLAIKSGTEVDAPGSPLTNHPDLDRDRQTIAIVKVDETAGVAIATADITDARELLSKVGPLLAHPVSQHSDITANGAAAIIGAQAAGATSQNRLATLKDFGLLGQNKIVNGNFDFWQRGNSFNPLNSGNYGPDRFKWVKIGSGGGVIRFDRDPSVPLVGADAIRSADSLKVQVVTSDAGADQDRCYQVQQVIEGYNIADLSGGFVLSFWVKSSQVQGDPPLKYCVSFSNGGPDQSYVAEYTIDAAGEWEKKSIAVPAPPFGLGAWNFTNGSGLLVSWTLKAGLNYQNAAGAWVAGDKRATANQLDWMSVGGALFYLSQVKLEAGTYATPFGSRHIGVEQILCERYREQGSEQNSKVAVTAFTNEHVISFKTRKRTAPLLADVFAHFKTDPPTQSNLAQGYVIDAVTETGFRLKYSAVDGASGTVFGDVAIVSAAANDSDAGEWTADAEL